MQTYKLYTADPRALSYVLTQTDTFQKPKDLRHILSSLVGQGLISAEGEEWRRQRKVMVRRGVSCRLFARRRRRKVGWGG
jgi:cytochrome P450